MSATKLAKAIGVIVSTIARYYTSGPLRPSWPLRLAVSLALARSEVLGKAPHSADDSTDVTSSACDKQQYQKLHDFFLRRITSGTPQNTEFRAIYQALEDSIVRTLGPKDTEFTACQTSFAITKRELKGILADLDAAADTTNLKVPAEWISSAQVSETAKAHDGPAKPNERIILYSHGGAYIRYSPRSHRGITMQLSKELNVRILSVEYRLAPENPFPSALHDLVSVYLALIDPNGKYKFEPHNIIVAGDSAGGNLTTSLFLYLRDNGLLLPAGGFLISPWLDLNSDSDSYSRNAPFDHLRFCGKGNLYHPTRLYTNPRATSWAEVQDIVNNPYVSPIKAESLEGLPPLLIQYGQCETPRDDIHSFAQRIIKEARPDMVLHEEYEDMVHVFHSFGFLKQTKDAYASFSKWADKVFSSTA